ncbi:MAG: serine/threonine-protein kinase [Leifsonia sp.]
MPADRQKLDNVVHELYSDAVDIQHLGTGGFASTFKVTQAAGVFAVKIVDPEVGDVDRFDRELNALKRVENPHVVRFLNFGRVMRDGVAYGYIEMEFVDGYSLADLITAGQSFSLLEAARLINSVLDGAATIWEAGVAHRDLSPRNIMVRQDGSAVIVDLGMARHVDDETLTALPMPGTPGWMSPEQVDLSGPSHGDWRSDQFVIGLLAYFTVTGARPYRAGSVRELWAAPAQQDAPSLRSGQSNVPEALANVVDRMTARQPSRRYLKPGALILDFERAIAALEIGESAAAHSSQFFPVVKYYNGYARDKEFLESVHPSVTVVGAQATKAMKSVFAAARAGGGRVAIDPDTAFSRSPRSVRPKGYQSLAYGKGTLLKPWDDQTAREAWCADVWREMDSNSPDILISPYFYAGPSELNWIRESLECAEVLRRIVAGRPGPIPDVWTGISINQSWITTPSERDKLLNELTSHEMRALYLLVHTTQEAFAPLSDLATIRGFRDLFSVMRDAEVPVIAAQRGSSGLLLLALGAMAWSGGVSANLLNSAPHPEAKSQKRRGAPRIYVPQLLNFVPGPSFELMLAEDESRVQLVSAEGQALLEQASDFSQISSAQRVLLYQHNVRAMKDQADALDAATEGQRVAMLLEWITDAAAHYSALQAGNVPAFLAAWRQALTER